VTYDEEQARQTCVEALQLGRRVERAAARRHDGDDTMAVADAVGVTRTRRHLMVIKGGRR
jgi:hypothetical protein